MFLCHNGCSDIFHDGGGDVGYNIRMIGVLMLGNLLSEFCGGVGYHTVMMMWLYLVPYWHDGMMMLGTLVAC